MADEKNDRTPIRSVCFTGHRTLPGQAQPAFRQLVRATEGAILHALSRGARRFYCGGAEGFDLLCGELTLRQLSRYPSLELVLLLPYSGFGDHFPARDRQRLQRLAQAAAETVYLSPHYYSGCMAIRNRQLVEDAELCIAYLRTAHSGTAQTVSFAREKGIEVIYV